MKFVLIFLLSIAFTTVSYAERAERNHQPSTNAKKVRKAKKKRLKTRKKRKSTTKRKSPGSKKAAAAACRDAVVAGIAGIETAYNGGKNLDPAIARLERGCYSKCQLKGMKLGGRPINCASIKKTMARKIKNGGALAAWGAKNQLKSMATQAYKQNISFIYELNQDSENTSLRPLEDGKLPIFTTIYDDTAENFVEIETIDI